MDVEYHCGVVHGWLFGADPPAGEGNETGWSARMTDWEKGLGWQEACIVIVALPLLLPLAVALWGLVLGGGLVFLLAAGAWLAVEWAWEKLRAMPCLLRGGHHWGVWLPYPSELAPGLELRSCIRCPAVEVRPMGRVRDAE